MSNSPLTEIGLVQSKKIDPKSLKKESQSEPGAFSETLREQEASAEGRKLNDKKQVVKDDSSSTYGKDVTEQESTNEQNVSGLSAAKSSILDENVETSDPEEKFASEGQVLPTQAVPQQPMRVETDAISEERVGSALAEDQSMNLRTLLGLPADRSIDATVRLGSELVSDQFIAAKGTQVSRGDSDEIGIQPARQTSGDLNLLLSRLALLKEAQVTHHSSGEIDPKGQWLLSGSNSLEMVDRWLRSLKGNETNKLDGKPASTASTPDSAHLLLPTGRARAVGQFYVSFENNQNLARDSQLLQAMSGHLKTMRLNQMQFAQITVKPANLGPIEVMVKQDQDQTKLIFVAKHPEVRELIETNLIRLQKAFAGDDAELTQAFVTDDSSQFADSSTDSDERLWSDSNKVPHLFEALDAQTVLTSHHDGELDLWA